MGSAINEQQFFYYLGKNYLYKNYPREDLIFFSYRKKFPQLKKQNGLYENRDDGWGCAIRSCQMMLGYILNHLSISLNDSIDKQELRKKIIRLFIDSPNCLFSLHNICKVAEKNQIKSGKVGEYWRPNTVFWCFDLILKELQANGNEAVFKEFEYLKSLKVY